MISRDARTVGRFSASVVASMVLVVGVPLALARTSVARFGSANPLAGMPAPWRWTAADVGSALGGPLGDDTVVDVLIRVSLVLVWISVGLIVVTTAVEVVHMIRHAGLASPPVRGFGWVQAAARTIAVGLLVVMPVLAPRATLAGSRVVASRQAPAESTTADPVEPSGRALTGAVTTTATGPWPGEAGVAEQAGPRDGTYVVRRGDSIYSIASMLTGNDEHRTFQVADAIVDANLGATMADGSRFTSAAYIEPGWELAIPAPVEAGGSTYVVEPGDTLWRIADTELGSGTAWTAIWELNDGDDMGGGRSFDDPNLILPGWELDLPGSSLDAAAAATVNVDPAPVTEPAPSRVPVSSLDTVETAPATNASVEREEASTVRAPTTTSVTPPVSIARLPEQPGERGVAPDAPSPVRLEHAAMLAAGVLALVGVRRRRRLRSARPGARVPEPRSEVVVTERLMRRIDPGERAARVDVACRSAAFALVGTGVQIVAARVSPRGDITLTLSGDAAAPSPWAGGGSSWRLHAQVAIEALTEPARMVGMPCLAFVQLGLDDEGCEVLVDLEACGTLAVDAHPAQADSVVRAIAAGLASSLYAEVAHLVTVSMAPEVLLGHRNAHRTGTVDEAFELAAGLVGSTSENDRSSFELRSLRTGGEVWEPAVILLLDADHRAAPADELRLPMPGRGIAVVTVTGRSDLPDAPARLVAEPDGWLFHAGTDTIRLTPIGLDRADLDAVLDVLADVQQPLVWMDDPGGATEPVDRPAGRSSGSNDIGAGTTAACEQFVPMQRSIVVSLLGGVAVTDRDGTPGRFERSKTVELIAWLATHRRHPTRSAARTALWDLDVRDATFANVVSEARRALGRLVTPPEGEEWLARTLTEQLPLHPLVVTDAQLVEERLEHSRRLPPEQAIETLRPAVELVSGMPFAGTDYLWPDAEGITSNLVLLAIGASAELASHALALGDTDLVFWSTGRGLSVLPGHEELIALRMRAHARTGDLAAVRLEWESYERVIVADAWSDGEPAPKMLALRRELLTGTSDASGVQPTGSAIRRNAIPPAR